MNQRNVRLACAWVAAAMWIGAAARGEAKVTIVVDAGPFKDAATAATAEAKVNWLDADLRDDDARTLAYYEACVRGWRALSAKDPAAARKHLAEAERLATLLKQDTTSTKHSSSHANAPNAFEATYATGAIGHLRKAIQAAGKQ